MVAAITVCVGLFLASVAYIRIYKVVKYHQNRIQGQTQQQNPQEMEQLRQKKSAYNAFFVFLVFVGCYFPLFIFVILDTVNSSQISLAGRKACLYLFGPFKFFIEPCRLLLAISRNSRNCEKNIKGGIFHKIKWVIIKWRENLCTLDCS